ncbi:MAG: twin-arginine translocase TatA/TatE family subunit [Candidatus Eisenbacteria bacterium]|uniref:Sec-independent protein translocase protein TatA n=1 Tax=Eiseniibacteriota bacterium TaxID=2212470 RepID=A0A937X840_UNCEI|nr:twin-arginine translocase TatA/TatE family subunit [Candidatus Eisenbacteria bacterium]
MESPALAMLLGPLGTTELLIIVLVLLLLFGGRKIPELARGLGRGISEFRDGMRQQPDKPKPGADDGAGGAATRQGAASEVSRNDAEKK